MERITLTGVPETMLQTVFARAQETKKPNHKITDEKAVEIIAPIYKVIGKIPAVRNLSNKIIVLEGRQTKQK